LRRKSDTRSASLSLIPRCKGEEREEGGGGKERAEFVYFETRERVIRKKKEALFVARFYSYAAEKGNKGGGRPLLSAASPEQTIVERKRPVHSFPFLFEEKKKGGRVRCSFLSASTFKKKED